MLPNLKLAGNSSVVARQLGREVAQVPARHLVLHTLAPVTATPNHNDQQSTQAKAKPAYSLLMAVIGAHLVGIFWLLNAAPTLTTYELKAEQSTISVSLLSPPTAAPPPAIAAKTIPIVKSIAKPIAKPAKKHIEKLAAKPVEKLIPAKTETATTTPEAVVVEATSAAPTDSTRLVAPTEIASAPTTAPVAEASIEPPRFAAAYLHNPAPEYPNLSRRMGEQGRVLLRVLVSSKGMADTVQIESSSGSSKLDQAALNAVEKWNFVPAKRSNQAVSAYVLVPLKFSLNN